MKDRTSRDLAIRFVLDRHGRHHDVADLHLRDIHAQPDGRHAYRCASCLEPVTSRAGFIRQPFFAHYPGDTDTPSCPWRTDLAPAAFHGRNPTGDDGKWHIDVQCEVMAILETMGCNPVRNTGVHTPGGLRKPDIAVTIDNQTVHFEIQASPTSAWCAARRIDRDLTSNTATLWIVSADAFSAAHADDNIPAWIDTLAAMGNGQIWLWNHDCYTRSRSAGQLDLLRSTIDQPGEIQHASLPTDLPRIVPFALRLNAAGRLQRRYPRSTSTLNMLQDNLCTLRTAFADELRCIASRLNQTFRYNYARTCINSTLR